MTKSSVAKLVLAVALTVGLATAVQAADSKCGAGKCGGKKESTATKCGGDKAAKCGAKKDITAKCGAKKETKATKCGAGKCGGKKQ